MSMKVLVAFDRSQELKERIVEAAAGRCELIFTRESGEDKARTLPEAEVVIGNLTQEELAQAKNLRWLQIPWSGVNAYSAMEHFPQTVMLTNTTGAFGKVISEHMIGSMLVFCRTFVPYVRNQQQSLWRDAGEQKTLEGKTALILGAGDIGTETAKRLRAFEMHIIGVRRTAGACPDCYDEMHTLDALDILLPLADYILCALPDTPLTRGLFDEARLLRCKKDAVLVNVGRGSLIVTDDLVRVMRAGHLWGASLDVTDPEPLPSEHPLWQLDNVLITPHVAGASFGHLAQTEEKIIGIIAENLDRYLDGRPLKNVVDLAVGYRPAP